MSETMRTISSYVLGTAQLGMPYGIANRIGQPNIRNATDIVAAAWRTGCRTFDTAQHYGSSEKVLGEALERLGLIDQAQVISKFDPAGNHLDAEWLRKTIMRTHEYFCARTLYGYMLHRYEWLQDWNACLKDPLLAMLEEGVFRVLGVSVNSAKEAAEILKYPEIGMVQIPSNAWDHELLESNLLIDLKMAGKQVFARSIFLQGLLLLSADEVATKLPFAEAASREWIRFCEERGLTPWQAAMRYGLALGSPLVLGAETAEQAHANGEGFALEPFSIEECRDLRQRLRPFLSEKLLRPMYWSAI